MRIRFTVRGKPVPWQRAGIRRGRTVRHYTPAETVKYQELVRRTAALAGCPVFAKGCRVELLIYFPDGRVRDRDNVLKSVLDSLQANKRLNRRAIAWNNDHDIGPFSVDWGIDPERPRIEVTITGDVVK